MPVNTSARQHHIGVLYYYCVCVSQSCLTLCNPVDCGPPGSSVHGILQTRILLPFPSPGDLPYPGINPTSHVLCIGPNFMVVVIQSLSHFQLFLCYVNISEVIKYEIHVLGRQNFPFIYGE